jgi:hypothetical protein
MEPLVFVDLHSATLTVFQSIALGAIGYRPLFLGLELQWMDIQPDTDSATAINFPKKSPGTQGHDHRIFGPDIHGSSRILARNHLNFIQAKLSQRGKFAVNPRKNSRKPHLLMQ